MLNKRHFIATLAASAVLMATPAAAEYPEKAISLVISFSAGGGTDTLARVVADEMSKTLGQPVTPVNRPGAGGGIAAMTAARAKPDGYTVLFVSSSTMTLNPKLNEQQNFSIDDFDYVGMVSPYQVALVAPAGRPYDTVEEFVVWAKENPNTTYGQFTAGSAMGMNVFEKEAGFKTRRVPLEDGSGSMNSLISGQIDVGYSGGIHQRYPDDLKVIAALGSQRTAADPDVPTLKELGYNVALDSIITLAVPKGTDPEAIERLSAALETATQSDALREIAGRLQFPIEYKGPEETAEAIAAQSEAYDALVEAAAAE